MLFSVVGHHHLEKMLIFPNTSATALALHPKSFGEMSRGGGGNGGNSMCDELFFCFYVTSITIELRFKKKLLERETLSESQGLHVLSHLEPFTGLVLSNSVHVRAADRPYVC